MKRKREYEEKKYKMLANMTCQEIDVCKFSPGFIFIIYDFAIV